MRTLIVALAVGGLAACATFSGEIDDGGRAYRETINAPVAANLEPLAAEPTIRLVNERIPRRGGLEESAAPSGDPPVSACEAEPWQRLIGLTEAEVLERERELPEAHRVIAQGDMVTQDYRPERLNVYLDDGGRVFRVTCG